MSVGNFQSTVRAAFENYPDGGLFRGALAFPTTFVVL